MIRNRSLKPLTGKSLSENLPKVEIGKLAALACVGDTKAAYLPVIHSGDSP